MRTFAFFITFLLLNTACSSSSSQYQASERRRCQRSELGRWNGQSCHCVRGHRWNGRKCLPQFAGQQGVLYHGQPWDGGHGSSHGGHGGHRGNRGAQASVGGCFASGNGGSICDDQAWEATVGDNSLKGCHSQSRCTRQQGGRCGWQDTPELRQCLNQVSRFVVTQSAPELPFRGFGH